MWRCSQCAEDVDDDFDACWNCGTSVDGVLDSQFVSYRAFAHTLEPEAEPDTATSFQFRLRDLFVWTTLAAVFVWLVSTGLILYLFMVLFLLLSMAMLIAMLAFVLWLFVAWVAFVFEHGAPHRPHDAPLPWHLWRRLQDASTTTAGYDGAQQAIRGGAESQNDVNSR